jgi:hypothetical protein
VAADHRAREQRPLDDIHPTERRGRTAERGNRLALRQVVDLGHAHAERHQVVHDERGLRAHADVDLVLEPRRHRERCLERDQEPVDALQVRLVIKGRDVRPKQVPIDVTICVGVVWCRLFVEADQHAQIIHRGALYCKIRTIRRVKRIRTVNASHYAHESATSASAHGAAAQYERRGSVRDALR